MSIINSLRKSGIDIIGNVPWGTHICQFYQTKEDLTDILVPYFKSGLENNEFCLWFTSQAISVEDAKEFLKSSVPDIDIYLEKGQIEIISYKQWYVAEGVFDSERVLISLIEKLNYASYNGYDGMRLSGDASWLDKEYLDCFIKYEERTDNFIDKFKLLALCTYSLNNIGITEIIKLSANHQLTLIKSEGIWEQIESSERKKAEETAIRATKDWEHTFDAVPDLIAIIDTNFRIVRANRAMASKLGITPEKCIGLTCYNVVHEVSIPPSFCPHRQMLIDGLEHTSEVCEECLGGYFIVSVSPQYDSNGKLAGSIHVARDINERRQIEEALRQSEAKFRNLIETANEGIHLIDAQHKNTFVNEKMVEMLGYSREELIGKSVRDFTDDEGKAVFEMNMKKRMQGVNESHEFKYIKKDGTPLWVLVNSKSLFDKDGKFAGSISMLTDITNRKETEEKLKETFDNLENLVKERTTELETAYKSLKESESSLAEAQKMAHIGNIDWDLVTGEIHWSNEMYNIFKLDPQEPGLTYNKFLNYMHPEDRYRINNAIKKVLNGESVAGDYSIIVANGEERKIFSHLKTIFNEKGAPIQIKGTFQDITALKRSEEKIRNLANIVESSYDAIVTISFEGKITSWNKSAEQVYGYSQEEIIGKPISFIAPFHLSDETKKLIERIMRGESVYNYETLLVGKNGKFINVSLTLSPVYDLHGKITAASAISRDITEKKVAEEKLRESEEKYRNIVETANEGIVIINDHFKASYVNQKMADMVGHSIEDCLDKPILDFISEDCREIIITKFKNRSRVVSENYEFKLQRKDGSYLWVFSSAKSLFDKDGLFIGSLSMLTDITRKKEAEIELKNAEKAQKKEIHHRIKNNLQVISSLLDLQADKFRTRKKIKNSEVLEAFRESQDRVISMALIHEELHRGNGFEKLNFSPYVEELSNNLLKTYSLGIKKISLNLNLDNNVFFDMDIAVPLGMIINELISNSFKHAFKGRYEGKIQIELHREEIQSHFKSISENSAGTTFVLTISDDGIGIPANLDIETIDSLGLQLVTSLVTQLDGELEIKINKGTKFIIRFTVTKRNNQMSLPPISQQMLKKTFTLKS